MHPFPSHRPSSELKDLIVQAFLRRIGTLDTVISPYPSIRKLLSHTFKPANLLDFLPFAWALACIPIVQHSQAQPFPFLAMLETSIFYSIGLSIPLISQFLWPASQVIIYAWTLYWFRSFPISLPLHLTVFLFPPISLSLWLFGPGYSLQYFAFLTGYANLMLAMIFIVLRATCTPPAKMVITYTGVFAGINTGLQVANLMNFFPLPMLFDVSLCLLSFLHGGLHDLLGFAAGAATAVASFYYWMPNELRDQVSAISDASSSLESGIEKSLESQDIRHTPRDATTDAAIDLAYEPVETQLSSSLITVPLTIPALPLEMAIENQLPTIESQPAARLPIIEQEILGIPQYGTSEELPSEITVRTRRRPSVGGPREPRYRPRPSSIDSVVNVKSSRRLPTPPRKASNRMSIAFIPNSTLPPELQARWNDNLFELQERLGESSSRVTFKVREKRSGLLYVRKTFFSRQAPGQHTIRQLFDLISSQDSPDASSNVVRCYGAYFPEVDNDGVRGIFEYCEGGSLHSISNVITQRGGIIGEKVAGRIALGVRGDIMNRVPNCLPF